MRLPLPRLYNIPAAEDKNGSEMEKNNKKIIIEENDEKLKSKASNLLNRTKKLYLKIESLVDQSQIKENNEKEFIDVKKVKELEKNNIKITKSDLQNEKDEKKEGKGKHKIYTFTIAKLYENQGLLDEAIEIYKNLSLKNPDDKRIKENINRLEEKKKLKKKH